MQQHTDGCIPSAMPSADEQPVSTSISTCLHRQQLTHSILQQAAKSHCGSGTHLRIRCLHSLPASPNSQEPIALLVPSHRPLLAAR